MRGVKCEKCGASHPDGPCPPGNDNAPFDEKSWRKTYMRQYMRRKRERLKAMKRLNPEPHKDRAS